MNKQLIIGAMLLMVNSSYAETLKTEFSVSSQTKQEFTVEVMVTGMEKSQSEAVQKLVEATVEEAAGQYTRGGFIASREIVINRLNNRMKRKNLSYDGFGILVLTRKDGKIVEVD